MDKNPSHSLTGIFTQGLNFGHAKQLILLASKRFSWYVVHMFAHKIHIHANAPAAIHLFLVDLDVPGTC